jgi:hypothetical protein
MEVQNLINEYIQRARAAQAIFEKKSQEEVDEAVKVIARVIVDNAVPLAEFAVNETGILLVYLLQEKHLFLQPPQYDQAAYVPERFHFENSRFL